MTRKFLFLGVLALLASCKPTAPDTTFTLTAIVPEDAVDETLYLVDFDTDEALDSAVIKADKVVFTGKADSLILARLIVNGARLGSVILEPGDIIFADNVAEGTPLNERMAQIVAREQSLSEEYQAQTTDVGRDSVETAYNKFIDDVVSQNSGNPIGYRYFLDKAYEMDLSSLLKAVEENAWLKNSVRVNRLIEAASIQAKTSPGKPFIDFEVPQVDGSTARFSDHVGKGDIVLVDFWASWCGPCIRETKVIKELLDEYGAAGLRVLGVAVWDDPDNTQRAIVEHQLPWPQIVNAQRIPTDIYGISGIPCILVIDGDGTILSRGKQGDDLRADVKAIMEGTLTASDFNVD